jgi:TPR repeat protein
MKRFILSLAIILMAGISAQAQTSEKEEFARNYEQAQTGDPVAMNELGKCYYYGRGVAKNPEEGFKWFLKAAHQNNVNAIEMVAYMYDYGEGTDFDLIESIYWNKKGAEMGSGYCMCQLGLFYLGENKIMYPVNVENKDGGHDEIYETFIDKKKGIEWLKKSARTGYKFAQSTLEDYNEKW